MALRALGVTIHRAPKDAAVGELQRALRAQGDVSRAVATVRTMCEIKTVAHTPLCVESVFFRGFHSFRDHPGWRGLSTPREAKVVAYPGVVIPELN